MQKIAIVYSNIRCSCTRKCTFELSKGLKNNYVVDIVYFLDLTEEHFKNNDIIIFQRLGGNGIEISNKETIFYFISKYKKKKYIIYQIDDLIFNFQEGLPIEFMKRSNAVLVPNEYFIQFVKPYCETIFLTRTFVDIKEINNIKSDLELPGDKIKFLWASTHGVGTLFMNSLIVELDKRYNCMIYNMGRRYNEIIQTPKVVNIPILDFKSFIKYFKSCDIILNPIDFGPELAWGYKRNDFINCKSEIKYLDAALCKKPFITSRSFSYNYAVKNEINGFILSNNIQEWISAIDRVIENRDGIKDKIIENAYFDVFNNYNLDVAANKIYDQLEYEFNTLKSGYSEPSKSNKLLGYFSNNRITQKIFSDHNYLCRIDVFGATYLRKNKCTLTLEVIEKNSVVSKTTISCENLPDNDYFVFNIPAIKNSENKEYVVEIQSLDSSQYNHISFYKNYKQNLIYNLYYKKHA